MPMFDTGRTDHHITGPDRNTRPAFLLRIAFAAQEVEHLTLRVGMPVRSGSGRKSDDAAVGDHGILSTPEHSGGC